MHCRYKERFLLGCGALLFALALNLNYAANDYGILENSLSTQVLAQSTTTGSNSNGSNSNGSNSNGSGSNSSSSVEWNHWTQWPSQGLTKDEREFIRPCPSSSSSSGSGSVSHGDTSVSGSASSSQTNPSSRNEITCPYGSENCSSISC